MTELQELIQKILSFRDERNWKQFHTPRNLAAALAIEAGELQEVMFWKTDGEVRDQEVDGSNPLAPTNLCYLCLRPLITIQQLTERVTSWHCTRGSWWYVETRAVLV